MKKQNEKEQLNDVEDTELKENRETISIFISRSVWVDFSYLIKKKRKKVYEVIEELIKDWIKKNQ